MQMIASNEEQLKALAGKGWGFWSKCLVGITGLIIGLIIIIQFVNFPFQLFVYLIFPLFGVLLISIMLALNEWIKGHPTPFCAYADQDCLYINFVKDNTSRNRGYNTSGVTAAMGEPRNYCFSFKQILGYKLHVFFKNPTAIEIQLDENRPEILNMIIPLNSLNKKESLKLVAFLEGIIPHQTINEQNRLN